MNVIALRTLKQYWEKYPDAEKPLRAWYAVCRKANWTNLDEVQDVYPHADAVGECTVFNVGGNDHRLIVKIRYRTQRIYIRQVLTHKEYSRDKWKNDCNCKK